jgi:hypothetical protein
MIMKSKQRLGSENGRWKKGKSSDYQRRITHAKKGELVHHVDENRTHNAVRNLMKLKPSGGITAIGKHNKQHPEKGRK